MGKMLDPFNAEKKLYHHTRFVLRRPICELQAYCQGSETVTCTFLSGFFPSRISPYLGLVLSTLVFLPSDLSPQVFFTTRSFSSRSFLTPVFSHKFFSHQVLILQVIIHRFNLPQSISIKCRSSKPKAGSFRGYLPSSCSERSERRAFLQHQLAP